jgi:hypothetical protein
MDVIEFWMYDEEGHSPEGDEPLVLQNGEGVEGTWTVTWDADGARGS